MVFINFHRGPQVYCLAQCVLMLRSCLKHNMRGATKCNGKAGSAFYVKLAGNMSAVDRVVCSMCTPVYKDLSSWNLHASALVELEAGPPAPTILVVRSSTDSFFLSAYITYHFHVRGRLVQLVQPTGKLETRERSGVHERDEYALVHEPEFRQYLYEILHQLC